MQTTIAELPALIGQELVSDWLEIDQGRVNRFADATDDHNWIHVDVERATRELGGPIAHGFLTLSLLVPMAAQMLEITDMARGLNYGCDRVRFMSMVKVGKRVRLRRTLLSLETRAGGVLMRNACVVEIEGEDKPACAAETLTLLYGG